MSEITVFGPGLYRANPDAEDYNLARIRSKDTTTVIGQDSGESGSSTGNLVAIEHDGVKYDTAATVATDTDAVVAEVYRVLTDVVANPEINPIIEASYGGGKLTITHVGQGTLGGFYLSDIGSGATKQATTRLTAKKAVFTYAGTVEGAASMTYDGSTNALDNTPYAYTDGGATDAATASDLETDFAAELTALSVPGAGDVTVTIDNDAEVYRVTFTADSLLSLVSVSGIVFKPTGWTVAYTS